MSEASMSSKRKLVFSILFCVVLCVSITITLVLALSAEPASVSARREPVSTPEQKEQWNREKLAEEFEGLVNIRLIGESEGLRGKLEDYFLEDVNGEVLGKVTVEAATREMVSINHNQDETIYGTPELSLEDLRAIALDYLARWGYEMNDDYRLESEELHPEINSGPGVEEKSYVYMAGWSRMAGGFAVLDDSYSVSVDPYRGEVVSCCLPSERKGEAEAIAGSAVTISEQEAIDAARASCPSPDEWMQGVLSERPGLPELDIEVSIDARELIQTNNQDIPVIWQVEIMYEIYSKAVEQNSDTLLDHQGYSIEVDARSGEIVFTDMCR